MHITSEERCTGFYELETVLQLFGSPENKGHKYWHIFLKLTHGTGNTRQPKVI
jgi:hypothetical protein